MTKTEIKKLIQQAVKSRWDVDLELEEIKINYSPEGFGDYSTNIALALAKKAKSNPMEAAEEIVEEITKSLRGRKPEAIPTRSPRSSHKAGLPRDDENGFFAEIKVVKPGFINFYLTQEYLQKQVAEIIDKDADYGKSDFGENQKVQVEFISANPTGPLTLGNGRGGFYGDVLANVLAKAGYGVEREYYVNDVGEQIRKLGHSVIGDEQAVYKGEYVDELRRKLDSRLRGNDKERSRDNKKNVEMMGKQAAEIIMREMIKPVIENKMKIKFDRWFSESELHPEKVDEIIDYLKEKDLAYEKENALWFKSTQFGDEKDRVLIKADKEKTYLASDVAYLKNKFERGFEKLIYIWGADHHGYVGRIKATASALGYNSDDIEIIIMQLVRLMSGGKEVRMSKRAGTYITLDELLDEISLDVARFFFLMYSPDTHMNFDLDLAKEQSQKNPVYYAQYAYARISSILRKTQNNFQFSIFNFQLLNHENELKLIKQLIRLPEIIEDIARDYQVHQLPHYALDLVRQFHKFYEEYRVIDEKAPDLTEARLALVQATQIVLKNVLGLMGISAPEKM